MNHGTSEKENEDTGVDEEGIIIRNGTLISQRPGLEKYGDFTFQQPGLAGVQL